MDEHNFKISIVMPVYNVEKYLRQCMDSIFAQTFTDIEVIAVNDGSTDDSLNILTDYQRRYPELMKVYTTDNHGVSHARNYGIARAKGDYILFVDSDDFIEPDMCEKLYTKAVKDNNDLVICGRFNVFEDKHTGQLKRDIINPELINYNFKLSDNKYELAHILPFPWDKLFRRELLAGMEFPEGMRFEDLVFVYKVIVRADNIGVVNEPLYNYRKTTQGGFLNSFSKQTLDIVKAFELVFDYMQENNYMDKYYRELEFICARHFLYRYITLFKNENRGKGKLDIKLEIINKTQDFLDSRLPDWRNNNYLTYSSGWLKKRLPLFKNRKKMVLITKLRERTPNKMYGLIKAARDLAKKLKNKLNKFRRSKAKLALIKKRLPFLAVLMQKGSVYYTHAYETLKLADKDILLESKHGEDIAGNIFALLKELSGEAYRDYNVLLAMEPSCKAEGHKLLSRYGINNVRMLDIFSREYMRALASSKYLVTDTSFPAYFIKKEGQVYLNTWHGTPLKAMGRIVPKREYALGNIQRNFLIADYLLYQNDFSREVFQRDYMIKDIYPGKSIISGYPRNSVFFDAKRRDIIRQECNISDKQVIVYMPTWRGLLHNKETEKQIRQLEGFFTALDGGLGPSQIIYVKLHPYVKDQMDYSGYKHIKGFPKEYETYDFLNSSDALVTDYSSIMFDYAVTNRKIVLFTYDRDEYLEDRGLYLDLNELGFPVTETIEGLIAELNNEQRAYSETYNSFCSYDSAATSKQICDMLLYGKTQVAEKLKLEDKPEDDRKKVLIYLKGFKRDIESQKRIDMVNSIDTDKFDVYVCMKANDVKGASAMLSKLKKEISYFPLIYEVGYTRADYFRCKVIGKVLKNSKLFSKGADRVMKREKQKYFGDISFDYVIHHSALDRMVGHLCLQLGDKVIYNFKYFSQGLYKKSRDYRKAVNYFTKLQSRYELVIAGKECKSLKLVADNLIFQEEAAFSVELAITQEEAMAAPGIRRL